MAYSLKAKVVPVFKHHATKSYEGNDVYHHVF
jgi:hypothetical protein